MKTLLLALSLALSSFAHAQSVRVTVVPVESADDFRAWLGKPVNPERAASPDKYPGALKALPIGTKTQLPILVSGLPSPPPMELVADVEILGSDGRSLGRWPRCCSATIMSGPSPSAVVLAQAVVVEPEPGRSRGSYTVSVSVTDGVQKWTARQVLPYGGEGEMPGSANEVPPHLRQDVPPNAETGDKRDCLSLPTPAEVIKCSEKKK